MHLLSSLKITCADCILNPNDKPYATNMNGCFTVFKTSLENSKTTIEIVTGTIIAVMVSILIFDLGSKIPQTSGSGLYFFT